MTASAPGASALRPPKGWVAGVWELRITLLYARERLPWASPNARLLDGVERWVRMGGRGRQVGSGWWAHALALVGAAAAACDDAPTTALLAPWLGGVRPPAPAPAGPAPGFRVVGADP